VRDLTDEERVDLESMRCKHNLRLSHVRYVTQRLDSAGSVQRTREDVGTRVRLQQREQDGGPLSNASESVTRRNFMRTMGRRMQGKARLEFHTPSRPTLQLEAMNLGVVVPLLDLAFVSGRVFPARVPIETSGDPKFKEQTSQCQ